jgi:LmbE family N-acetylglucosaminyl deacetylase
MRLFKTIWRIIRQEILKYIGKVAGKPFIQTYEHSFIIAPHPDDEVFSCGGLISNLTGNGKNVSILFLTKGEASHQGCCNASIDQIGFERKALAERADRLLGLSQQQLFFLSGKDGNIPHKSHEAFLDMATQIANTIKELSSDVVFCPHPSEGWSDHIAATELTVAAISMLPSSSKPKLYYYCVWFWLSLPLRRALKLDWSKALLLDISEQLSLKRQAMNVYLGELAPCGNPWVGNLPKELLRAFEWGKELFFEADISLV